MKRLPLLSRLSAALVVLLSLLAGSCGPSPEQQATLVAFSVNATLTSEAARVPPPPTIPPTIPALLTAWDCRLILAHSTSKVVT